MHDRAAELRSALEHELERLQSAQDVLRELRAIDPEHQAPVAEPALQVVPLELHGRLGRDLGEVVGVHADRIHVRADAAIADLDGAIAGSTSFGGADAREEVLHPPLGLEPDHVGSEQSFDDPARPRVGQEPDVVRLGEGDVPEVADRKVRAHLAQDRRHEGEVIVLDQRDAALRCGLRGRLGEAAVHVGVGLPRVRVGLAERRRSRRVPEVMVCEPEHAVREFVVIGAIDIEIDRDQPHGESRTADLGLDRVVFGSDGAVGVADRARDPQPATLAQRAGKRRHQAADAAAMAPLTGRRVFERDRAAVGDDDDRSVHDAKRGIPSARDGRRGRASTGSAPSRRRGPRGPFPSLPRDRRASRRSASRSLRRRRRGSRSRRR